MYFISPLLVIEGHGTPRPPRVLLDRSSRFSEELHPQNDDTDPEYDEVGDQVYQEAAA